MNISQKRIFIALVFVLMAGITLYYYNIKSLDNIRSLNNIKSSDNINEMTEPAVVQATNTISIGTVADDAVKQIKIFQPTADYIAAKLSTGENRYEGKIVIVKTIDNMTGLLKEQKIDLYVDSSFAAVMAANKTGSVPFLRRWKDGVGEYHSVFIVKNDSSVNMENLKGKTIAFEDPGSTSAYFLPKAHLIQMGYEVNESPGKNNIRYVFTGEDENTPVWVIEGKADIGAVSDRNYLNFPASIKDKLKIVDRTIDVPRHVVSHRSDMDPALLEKIKQILINMDKDPQGLEVLKNFKTKKYDVISNKDELFANITRMIEILE